MSRLALLLLTLPAAALAAKPDLPVPAMKALETANGILGAKSGDERVLACLDAMPFLDIVIAQAPNYAYAVGLAGECRYLTDDFEKAVPLLQKYIALVPAKARQKEVADKVERAELRLMKAKQVLADRKAANAPPPPEKPVLVVKKEPDPPPPPPKPPEPPKVVEAPPPPKAVEPPPAPMVKEFALRAGFAAEAGVLGLSGEVRLGSFALSVGSGGYPVGAGARWLLEAGPGLAYVEGHAVVLGSSPFVRRLESGVGFGATVGYDYRPIPLLSLKVGVGAAHAAGRGTGLVLDAAVGPVFGF